MYLIIFVLIYIWNVEKILKINLTNIKFIMKKPDIIKKTVLFSSSEIISKTKRKTYTAF